MRTSNSLVARGSLVKKLRMRRASGTWKNAMGSMAERKCRRLEWDSEDGKQTDHKRQRAGLAFHKSRVHGLSQEISYVKRVGCTIVGLGSAPAWIWRSFRAWGHVEGGPTS
jgi:hypothetical protein